VCMIIKSLHIEKMKMGRDASRWLFRPNTRTSPIHSPRECGGRVAAWCLDLTRAGLKFRPHPSSPLFVWGFLF